MGIGGLPVITLEIKVKRHKGGTWEVYINHPDGSWQRNRGLVDEGHAQDVICHAIAKADREYQA